MKIPYVNLGIEHENILNEILEAIKEVMLKGNFILGNEVEKFEKAFSTMIGTKYAVGVNSGTDALILAMKALDIKEDDEIITVGNSFTATVASIELLKAKPVLVDVLENQNIDYNLIEQKITKKTKAILPVHLTGRPANMFKINEIAKKYNLLVIEDCAQAVEAKLKGKKVGSFGDAGCFSLHPLKNLGACGDAGIIVTNNKNLHDRLVLLRNHGLKNRGESIIYGGNSRLDEIQAAILNVKLKYLNEWTQTRRRNAKYYNEQLRDTPLKLPIECKDEYCVYHAYVIQTPYRDKLKEFLASRGIETKIHYPIPANKQNIPNSSVKNTILPITEKQSNEILSLPVNPTLEKKHLDFIIKSIKEFFEITGGNT